MFISADDLTAEFYKVRSINVIYVRWEVRSNEHREDRDRFIYGISGKIGG